MIAAIHDRQGYSEADWPKGGGRPRTVLRLAHIAYLGSKLHCVLLQYTVFVISRLPNVSANREIGCDIAFLRFEIDIADLPAPAMSGVQFASEAPISNLRLV